VGTKEKQYLLINEFLDGVLLLLRGDLRTGEMLRDLRFRGLRVLLKNVVLCENFIKSDLPFNIRLNKFRVEIAALLHVFKSRASIHLTNAYFFKFTAQ